MSCARTHCADCALHRTRARKLLRRFPASAVDFVFFTDELVWKLVEDFLNTWFDRLLLWFAFISNCLSLASDFAALCLGLCQRWPYRACFLLGLQLNTMHKYKIWNVFVVANFHCYYTAKHFKDRLTTHRVIAKIKRVPVFWNTL